jgi:diguanylate cyclase (GGDEF)-like protein
MLQTDAREAYKVCEDIRKAVEKEKFYLPIESFKPVQAKVTVSIGLAKYNDKIAAGKELLEITDEALYKAKSEGRNRVVLNR